MQPADVFSWEVDTADEEFTVPARIEFVPYTHAKDGVVIDVTQDRWCVLFPVVGTAAPLHETADFIDRKIFFQWEINHAYVAGDSRITRDKHGEYLRAVAFVLSTEGEWIQHRQGTALVVKSAGARPIKMPFTQDVVQIFIPGAKEWAEDISQAESRSAE